MDVPTHGHQSASRSSPGTSETLERWQMNGLRYLVPAGAYGKSRREVTLDRCGARMKRVRKLPQSQWAVLIPNHHQGFIDWSTYEANRMCISANTHPRPINRVAAP